MPVEVAGFLVIVGGALTLAALITGRIRASSWFSRALYADRRDTPIIYWLITLGFAAVMVTGAIPLLNAAFPGLGLPEVPF